MCLSFYITNIYDSSHDLATDPTKINSEFSSFYFNLYKSQPPSDTSVMESFINNLDIPTISEEMAVSLDEPLKLEEITSCISLTQSNSFYKKFSLQLIPLCCWTFRMIP